MREIKFRGYSKELGMSQPFTLRWLAECKNGSDVGEFEIYVQYTGLKDKNSKEIYEGDMLQNVNDEKWIELVEWSRIRPMFSPFNRIASVDISWIVVGNIYENPDLLTPTHDKKD